MSFTLLVSCAWRGELKFTGVVDTIFFKVVVIIKAVALQTQAEMIANSVVEFQASTQCAAANAKANITCLCTGAAQCLQAILIGVNRP